jgi:DNA-binding NarL/FixJ family response regulator
VLRLLIADDHEIVRRALCEVLDHHPGWEIVGEAKNGREADKLALRTLPHVVLLDLFMPEMNGLEATRVIRRKLPEAEVLIFTVHGSDDLMREVIAAGARGYLLKTDFTRDIVGAVECLAEHTPFFSWQVAEMLLDDYVEHVMRAPSVVELTDREREVVRLFAEGRTTKSVASRLRLRVDRVEKDRSVIKRKIGAKSQAEMIRYALRTNMIKP